MNTSSVLKKMYVLTSMVLVVSSASIASNAKKDAPNKSQPQQQSTSVPAATFLYVYDEFGRLHLMNSVDQPRVITQFDYDSAGNRVSAVYNP